MVTGAGGSSFFGSLISSDIECRFTAPFLLVADCSVDGLLMLPDRPGDSRCAKHCAGGEYGPGQLAGFFETSSGAAASKALREEGGHAPMA